MVEKPLRINTLEDRYISKKSRNNKAGIRYNDNQIKDKNISEMGLKHNSSVSPIHNPLTIISDQEYHSYIDKD